MKFVLLALLVSTVFSAGAWSADLRSKKNSVSRNVQLDDDTLIDQAEEDFSRSRSRGRIVEKIESPTHKKILFVAPQLGATSLSDTTGGDRDLKFSYGVQALNFSGPWGVGIHLASIGSTKTGNQSIGVERSLSWFSTEAKVRFFEDSFMPYASLGAGGAFETVTTRVQNQEESISNILLLKTLGVGALGHFTQHWAFDFSIKYYQFSNVDGFNYLLSVGYSAPGLF